MAVTVSDSDPRLGLELTTSSLRHWQDSSWGCFSSTCSLPCINPQVPSLIRTVAGPRSHGKGRRDLPAEYSMRITVGYGDPARGQVRKLLRSSGSGAVTASRCRHNDAAAAVKLLNHCFRLLSARAARRRGKIPAMPRAIRVMMVWWHRHGHRCK